MNAYRSNLRDLGGVAAGDGLAIRPGVVWRSEAPVQLGPDELEVLMGAGLRTVVDLRTASERERDTGAPLAADPAVEALTVPDPDGLTAQRASELAGLLAAGRSHEVERLVLEIYELFPEVLAPVVGDIVRRVVAGRAPVLVHCAAGKDRTGFVCAALLHLAGADAEAIEQDYMRSDPVFDAPRMAELLSDVAGRPVPALGLGPLRCRPEYLRASFDAMSRAAGSVDAYLATRAGVGDALRRELRSRLVEQREADVRGLAR